MRSTEKGPSVLSAALLRALILKNFLQQFSFPSPWPVGPLRSNCGEWKSQSSGRGRCCPSKPGFPEEEGRQGRLGAVSSQPASGPPAPLGIVLREVLPAPHPPSAFPARPCLGGLGRDLLPGASQPGRPLPWQAGQGPVWVSLKIQFTPKLSQLPDVF